MKQRSTRNSSSRRKSQRAQYASQSPRAPFRVAVVSGLMALLVDTGAVAFTVSEYRKVGHLCFNLGLSFLALGMTALAAYTTWCWWKARSRT